MPRKSAAQPPKPEKRTINWEGVRTHYCAGIRSLADIAKEFGVSDAGIIKKAKAEGWLRNLKARIQAKAEARVSAAAVSEIVSVARAANEQTVIEANAELQYQITMSHRQGLAKLKKVKDDLLSHVEQIVAGLPDMADVVEILRTPDERGIDRVNDKMKKAMERSTVIDDLKKLAEIDEKVRKGECQAFGIDQENPDSPDGEKHSFEVVFVGNKP